MLIGVISIIQIHSGVIFQRGLAATSAIMFFLRDYAEQKERYEFNSVFNTLINIFGTITVILYALIAFSCNFAHAVS